MSMGIERVLKEKFGDAIKDIRQVYDEEVRETTVEVSALLLCLISDKKILLHFCSSFVRLERSACFVNAGSKWSP